MGAPSWPPYPRPFGTPRRSRGGPLSRYSLFSWGPRHGPHTPTRSARPGEAVARLYLANRYFHGGPTWPPLPPHVRHAPAKPWRASISLIAIFMGARHGPPYPPPFRPPRRSPAAPPPR